MDGWGDANDSEKDNTMSRTYTCNFKTFTINVIEGDITKVRADALITAINSGGMWYGGVDRIIQSVAGYTYHNQACARPLHDGYTVIAKMVTEHSATFRDVVFVVDDLKGPLSRIIIAGLNAANEANYTMVSMPAIRTGVMLGAVEKDANEAAVEIVSGIEAFVSGHSGTLNELTIVVYKAPEIFDVLVHELESRK